jgi:hypothetical protein
LPSLSVGTSPARMFTCSEGMISLGMSSCASRSVRNFTNSSFVLPPPTWMLWAFSSATVVSHWMSRPFGAVVVAHEEPHVVGQAQDLLDRVVERAGIAAGEIGTGRAAIGHEQRVADEGRVAHHMGHAGRRVAGRVDREGAHAADHVGVAILEQRVELAAVALELGAFVEDLAEGVLHHGDVAADADLAAELLLDVGRARQVVGMDMGLDQPLELQPLFA